MPVVRVLLVDDRPLGSVPSFRTGPVSGQTVPELR